MGINSFLDSCIRWSGFAVFVAALFVGNIAAAASVAEQCETVLLENFAAMGEENLEKLVGTCSPAAPRDAMQTFAKEAADLFEDADIHLSLVSFEFLGQRGQFATARVRQRTYVDENNGQGGRPTTWYRQLSRILPAHDSVEYLQIFHQYRGRWYVWTTKDEKKVDSPDGGRSLIGKKLVIQGR